MFCAWLCSEVPVNIHLSAILPVVFGEVLNPSTQEKWLALAPQVAPGGRGRHRGRRSLAMVNSSSLSERNPCSVS